MTTDDQRIYRVLCVSDILRLSSPSYLSLYWHDVQVKCLDKKISTEEEKGGCLHKWAEAQVFKQIRSRGIVFLATCCSGTVENELK